MISEVDKNKEIIGTLEISSQIELMFKERSEFLVLVTPYIKLMPRFKVLFEQGLNKIKKVIVLYRARELKAEERNWLEKFDNVELYPIENLHAKIYLNQNQALITSMNLYEFSQVNNHEIGFLFSREGNLSRYLSLLSQVNLILKSKDEYSNIDWIIDKYESYAVNKLFRCLMVEYDCYGKYNAMNAWWFFSREIGRILNYPKNYYIQSGALSRSIELSKSEFEDFYRNIDFMKIIEKARK